MSISDHEQAPTRGRVLAQVAEAADAGSVPAMVALERALRLGEQSHGDSHGGEAALSAEQRERVDRMLSLVAP